MVMDRDLSWGGEHTVLCTDDVWWSCALETYIILLTGVTPMHLIKRKKHGPVSPHCKLGL